MNIKLLYSKNLSDQTGASAVMRSFADNILLFNKYSICFEVFSREKFFGYSNSIAVEGKKKKSLNLYISQLLGVLAKTMPLAAYCYDYIRSIRPARKFVKKTMPYIKKDDVLFFHELFTCYYYLKYRGTLNNKIICVFHSDGKDFQMEKSRYANLEDSWYYRKLMKMQRYVLSHISKLGFVSKLSSETFISLHPEFDNSKVFYVYNGLENINYSQHSYDTYKIVCVGTVNERKGQHYIIDLSKIHFTIVGGGELLEGLRLKVVEFQLNDYITFVGPSNEVESILRKNNIFLLPSQSEGLPIAILEAMRNSLPIVSTPVGGIPEMIDNGKSGLLIEPSADGVFDLINNIEKHNWSEMGKVSHQLFMEKFSIERMIHSYSDIFKSIV